jgi:hypothetical protein
MTSVWWRAFPEVLRIGGAALILLAVASIARAEGRDPMKLPDTQLEPVAWSEIDGWAEDDHNAAFATFLNSCKAILRGTKEMREARPVYGALYEACRRRRPEIRTSPAKRARSSSRISARSGSRRLANPMDF